ncbi:hypothetical protein Tco_0608576 [Tanacetum coccineum]
MHNNIMAAGSKERPPMLGPGRYSQWRSRFLRYIDTKNNAEGRPAVQQHTTIETVLNMTPKNKEDFQSEKEAIFLLLTGIGDEIYSTVDACNTANEMWIAIERLQQGESLNVQDVKTNLFWEFGKFTSRDGESMESYYSRFYKLMNELTRNNLQVTTMQVNVQFLQQLQPEWSRFVTIVKQAEKIDIVSYHRLFDILKQFQLEVNDIRAERIAKSANPLALIAAAQPYSDTYYQAPKPQRSNATSSSTRQSASTRHKGKEVAKPITPQSESVSEEDSDPEQAQRDKEMQKNLALLAKYFKKLYKPTNNNLRTSSNSRNKTEDTTPRQSVARAGQRQLQIQQCKVQEVQSSVTSSGDETSSGIVSDEEIDKQKLEAHYSYMAKIQEVSPEESSSTGQPLEQVQNHDESNVYDNVRRHSEQPESINDTYVLEKDDSNVTPDSSNICNNDNQVDQNAAECVDERAALANLIANLTLDTEENKTILKQLKKANASLTQELEKCKTNLDETNSALGEAISCRDSCLIALQNKQNEFEKYKAFNDRTIDYEILQTKLNETLGLLALKDIEIKEGLKTKAYEISVLNQKHDELVKKSLLTRSQLEGYLKENTKVISDLKVKEDKDIDKMIEMDKQLKFLNEIVYTRNQSIQTIHMLAPKCSTYNGRPTFANPRYLKKAQSEKPCLYEIPYDTSDPANRFAPDREETMTLDNESRSKLDKDTVKPYDYTRQNSLYEIFKAPSLEYLYQLERAKEVRKTMWRKPFVRTKPNIAKNVAFLPVSKSISKSRQVFNEMTFNINQFREIVDQTWFKHTSDYFRVPTAHDMELLIKTLLTSCKMKTSAINKSLLGDELESEKADFSNMYDLLLEECVSKDVICSYLHSLSELNAHTELQCLYLHKVKECECLAIKLSKQTESITKWVPTGKLLNSCTGKVENEPTHGSNVDIPHIHACKQTLGLSAGTSFNGQKQQRIDLNADALYNAKQENLRVWPRSSMFKRRLIAADQASVFMAMTSDHNRSELGIHDHSNEPSSSKLVPKVVPLAVKTATSRQELELLFHHHIAMLRTTVVIYFPLKRALSSAHNAALDTVCLGEEVWVFLLELVFTVPDYNQQIRMLYADALIVTELMCLVNGKNAYELKGKFLDDLHNNAFSGTNGKDAVEHTEYYLKIIDPIKLPNVDHDKLRVVVFPISLAEGARRWFDKTKESIT